MLVTFKAQVDEFDRKLTKEELEKLNGLFCTFLSNIEEVNRKFYFRGEMYVEQEQYNPDKEY